MPYNFHRATYCSPSAKELKAMNKKQITDSIKKDRIKYASR